MSAVTIKQDNVAALLKSLHALTGREVLVGIPSTETDRKDKGDPMDNATLGYIHEFGAPAAGIPARPFLIPGVEEGRDAINKQLRAATEAGVTGNVNEVDRRLHAAGLVAQNAVRARINSGIEPELSPLTIAARKRRGRKGDKPLIDTGQLRNAITYVIRKK